jgi:hypothetical protein
VPPGSEIFEEQDVANNRTNPSDTINEVVEAVRDETRAATNETQDAISTGLDGMRHMTDQLTRAFGFTGQNSEALARQASDNLEALAETGTVLARGFQDVSREWLTLSQDRLRMNIEGLTQLARCRSMPDLVATQSDLMRDNWRQMIDGSRRIAERSIEVANEAARKIGNQAEAPDRTRRAA